MASESADLRDLLDFIERGERPLARLEPGFGIRDWGFAKAGLDVGYGTRRSAAECSGAQRPWPLPCRIPTPESRIPRQRASPFAPARPPATCSARALSKSCPRASRTTSSPASAAVDCERPALIGTAPAG